MIPRKKSQNVPTDRFYSRKSLGSCKAATPTRFQRIRLLVKQLENEVSSVPFISCFQKLLTNFQKNIKVFSRNYVLFLILKRTSR